MLSPLSLSLSPLIHLPRRWFDVSKQVVGSVLVHIANIMLSMLSSGTFTTEPSPASLLTSVPDSPIRRTFGGPPDDDPSYHPNPCSFYLLNLAIDVCPACSF